MALSRKPTEIVEEGKHTLLVKAPFWERVFVSEIAKVQNGYPFESESFTHGEGLPLIRIRDITETSTENFYKGEFPKEFLVNRGDLLIGMDGDFTAARWRGPDGLLNQRVCRLIQTTELYSNAFLFLCLQPYLNAINEETSSITVKHLSSRTVGEIPLPLPPLPEQRRIVAKLEELFSELDKGIENLKQARAQLAVYRQALLKHAFEGKLTAGWRKANADKLESPNQLLARIRAEREARYEQQLAEWKKAYGEWEKNGGNVKPIKPAKPEPQTQVLSEQLKLLPTLPQNWTYLRLGEVIDEPAYGTSKKCAYETAGTGVLRIPNVVAGAIDARDLKFAEFSSEEIQSYALQVGDLLIIRSNGSVSIVGRCAQIREPHTRLLYAGYLIRLRAHGNAMDSTFLHQQLSSHALRSQIEKAAKSTSGVNNINSGEIRSLIVAVSSVAEQREIMVQIEQSLAVINSLESDIDTNLRKAEVLRQSILKKAFAGELVPQDPADEPAADLLARIRAERAASQGASAHRKTKTTRNLPYANTKLRPQPGPPSAPG